MNNPLNTFQQNYMNQMQPFMPQSNQMNTLFANGIEGARQYPLEAGKKAIIFDSTPNSNVFFLKDTTGNGKPLRIFDYTEREEPDEAKELSDLKKQVANLENLVASLAKPLQELMGDQGKDDTNG